MKSLLRVEALEPRTLFAGLCGIPSTALPTPVESLPAPAAEIGPMHSGSNESVQAQIGVPPDIASLPATVVDPDSIPQVNVPGNVEEFPSEQTPPPSLSNPPSEAEQPSSSVDTGTSDVDVRDNSELKPDTGNNSPSNPLPPSCAADSGSATKSSATAAPVADPAMRTASPTSQPFISFFSTTASALPDEQRASRAVAPGNNAEDTSEFHYFAPLGPSRHSDYSLGLEPLSNVAVRETFVAFALMTKRDLEDYENGRGAVADASDSEQAISSAPEAVESPVEQSMADVNRQTDPVHRALSALANADDALREADAACAIAVARTAEPARVAEAAAQALANASAKCKQTTSQPTAESQPHSPRWQLGMCSLVSVLFSFRTTSENSSKSTAIRKSLFRGMRRAK